MDDIVSKITFARIKHLPYSAKRKLLENAGSVDAALLDSQAHPDFHSAEVGAKTLARLNAWCMILGDEKYPLLLAQIPDPPLVLFGIGELPKEQHLYLSMVGPRRPSSYGLRIAKLLAKDLAAEGLILVSGMARGIDAIAHEAALSKKMPTIAVLACGIDRIYPPEHAHLKSKIAALGAVITEFPPGEPPLKEYFPQRNRIISGLSKGTILIEAGEKSGGRITARHALEQSREVYALPGPIDSPLSFVPNRLISEGAKLVESSMSILEDYFPDRPKSHVDQNASEKLDQLSSGARELLNRLEMDTPFGLDEVVAVEDLAISDLLQLLSELEMCGFVAKRSDARYVRVLRS